MRAPKAVWQPIIFIASLNVVLIIVMLVMATTIMATPAGVVLNLAPPVGESKGRLHNVIDVKITAENVIYVNRGVVTINELRRLLSSPQLKGGVINVRADKRASVGRVMDILNICHGIAQGKVNVSALE